MPKTEIYKIPGEFNTPPSTWPRMAFPDLTKGLIEEWVADDLTVGSFPSVGWTGRKGLALTPWFLTGLVAPDVVEGTMGHKAVRFNNSQLRSLELPEAWRGVATYEFVINPIEGSSGGARVASGLVGQFRGIYMYTTNFSATTSQATNANLSTANLGAYTPGQITSVMARYNSNEVDGKVMGRPFSQPVGVTGTTPQTAFFVGANSSSPPSPPSFLKADIYRIRVWNRVLTNEEVDVAMAESAETYGF